MYDVQGVQENAMQVYSHSYWLELEEPSAGEGEVADFREFLEKTQYLMNTLYILSRFFGSINTFWLWLRLNVQIMVTDWPSVMSVGNSKPSGNIYLFPSWNSG